MKTLHLPLSAAPFEVMITSEKQEEFRKDCKWTTDRLLNPDGTNKEYDEVKFVNGYGAHRPWFTCEYLGYRQVLEKEDDRVYSNGLRVEVAEGVFIILLGKITGSGNL